MLVLSRRPSEKVLFPNLGISVQVLRIDGKAVRIGIDAPREIRVLREEVACGDSETDQIDTVLTRSFRHELRNRLNTAAIGLQLLHRQLETGQAEDAEATIGQIFEELQRLDAQFQQPDGDAPDSRPTDGRRALIVDDNANESRLLAEYLRISGYEVDTVHDGMDALSYLRQNSTPDAVLLDMCMPRLNGPRTISTIRDEPKLQDLKVFAVSGADRQELGVDLGPSGVDGWFSKPVNASELVREMNRVLSQPLMTA